MSPWEGTVISGVIIMDGCAERSNSSCGEERVYTDGDNNKSMNMPEMHLMRLTNTRSLCGDAGVSIRYRDQLPAG